MKRTDLQAEKRTLLGRKVKQLRLQKLLPANVYGKNVSSVAVQLPMATFMKAYTQTGETGLIDLQIEGTKRPVLIQNVQVHPVTNVPLHADFYQVDLAQKVKAPVPLAVVGTAAAVSQKLGVLLILLDEIEVAALPTELPEKIEIDVSHLAQVGDSVKVIDLKLPPGVTLVTDKETEVVKIASLITKEAEALAAAEEAAKAAAVAETAAAVAPAEGAPGGEPAAPPAAETKVSTEPVKEQAKPTK
jgi:large subunit ribosomal protein L25